MKPSFHEAILSETPWPTPLSILYVYSNIRKTWMVSSSVSQKHNTACSDLPNVVVEALFDWTRDAWRPEVGSLKLVYGYHSVTIMAIETPHEKWKF